MPSSPNVKKVTNASGFIPVRYTLRYGMYIVPQRIPAPSAAHTPFSACADAGACAAEAAARTATPKHISIAPPTTPIHRRQPACRSSLKNRNPHKMPSICKFLDRAAFCVSWAESRATRPLHDPPSDRLVNEP